MLVKGERQIVHSTLLARADCSGKPVRCLPAKTVKLHQSSRFCVALKAAAGRASGALQDMDEAQQQHKLQVPHAEGEVDPNALIIFVLGGPGSGKGTQCAKIAAKYGCEHLSAGDLLRDEVEQGSELGQQCDKMMKEGELVPTEVTISLLRNALVGSKANCFLIDGFPREVDQAHAFEESVKPCRLVLAFDCPFDVMEQRLKERSKTSDRADDNEDTMRKRFDTFQEQSKPVIEH